MNKPVFSRPPLLIGIGVSNHSSGGGSSSDDDAASTVSPSIVLTDASGNILNSGDTISDSTLTLSGEGMPPGSTVGISDERILSRIRPAEAVLGVAPRLSFS